MNLRDIGLILLAMVPSWLIINIIIGYMADHHLFTCWGCGG